MSYKDGQRIPARPRFLTANAFKPAYVLSSIERLFSFVSDQLPEMIFLLPTSGDLCVSNVAFDPEIE